MRMPGYCTACRRIRQVNVNITAMARAGGGPVQGLCYPCEARRDLTPSQRFMLKELELHKRLAVETPRDCQDAIALIRAQFARLAEGQIAPGGGSGIIVSTR